MLRLSPRVRIFAAVEPVDFRKAFDRLVQVVRDEFGEDPFAGDLFCSFNRRRDRVKVLVWDRNDFWLHCKRLERGTFGRLALSVVHEIARARRPERGARGLHGLPAG